MATKKRVSASKSLPTNKNIKVSIPQIANSEFKDVVKKQLRRKYILDLLNAIYPYFRVAFIPLLVLIYRLLIL